MTGNYLSACSFVYILDRTNTLSSNSRLLYYFDCPLSYNQSVIWITDLVKSKENNNKKIRICFEELIWLLPYKQKGKNPCLLVKKKKKKKKTLEEWDCEFVIKYIILSGNYVTKGIPSCFSAVHFTID